MKYKFNLGISDVLIKIILGILILPFTTCPNKPIRLRNKCDEKYFYFKIINNCIVWFNKHDHFIEKVPIIGYVETNMEGVKLSLFCKHQYNQMTTQVTGLITGLDNENIVMTKSGCIREQILAQQRTLMKRSVFDEKRLYEFFFFANKKLLPYWFAMIDEFFEEHKEFNEYTIWNWLKNYSPKQCREYLVAYLKVYDENFFNLSEVESHQKLDEIIREVLSGKCRNIIAQRSEGKILMGLVVYFGTLAIESKDKSYSSGRNFEDRNKEFSNDLIKYKFPIEVDIDGSGYDNTQYNEIKQIIDFPILNYILKKMELNFMKSYPCTDMIYSICNNNCMEIKTKTILRKTKFHYYFNYYKIGTVGSGFMNTSFGNTLRSISYIRFGLQNYYFIYDLYCNGDDTKLITEEEHCELVKEELMERVYVNNESNNLGQIAKYINLQSVELGNFISTTTIRLELYNEIVTIRQFDRIITGMSFSYKNQYEDNELCLLKNIELNISKGLELLNQHPNIEVFKKISQVHFTSAKILCKQINKKYDDIYKQVEYQLQYDVLHQIRKNMRIDDKDKEKIEVLNKKFHYMLIDHYNVNSKEVINTLDFLIDKMIKEDNPYAVVRCKWIDKILYKSEFGMKKHQVIDHYVFPNPTIEDNLMNKKYNFYIKGNKLKNFITKSLLKEIYNTHVYKLLNFNLSSTNFRFTNYERFIEEDSRMDDYLKVLLYYPRFDKYTRKLERNKILNDMMETFYEKTNVKNVNYGGQAVDHMESDIIFNYFLIGDESKFNYSFNKFDLRELCIKQQIEDIPKEKNDMLDIFLKKIDCMEVRNVIRSKIFNLKYDKMFHNFIVRLSLYKRDTEMLLIEKEELLNSTDRKVIKDKVENLMKEFDIDKDYEQSDDKIFNKELKELGIHI